jgi:Stress responsive A/B Barrel Domain
MRTTLRVCTVWIALLLVGGCQAQRGASSPAQPRAAVTHVVLCWLKTPGDDAARRKIIETSRTFESIPGVVSVTCGRALPSTRPVVDSSYDVAILITFTDEAALHAYDRHPTHKKAVDDVLKPLVGKFLVYDFKAD